MSVIFTPWRLGSLTLPNRLVRSATWEGMANDEGFMTPEILELYRRLAGGGVGLIVTGYAYVLPNGKGLPHQLGVFSDAHMDGLARLAEAIHEEGGRVLLQLVHAGGQTDYKTTGADELIAPSAVPYPSHNVTPRAIGTGEIPMLVEAFALAARRAMEAGYDGVQLHAAHGYLINRFLSPASNRRSDAYGGDIAKRARFGVEVLRAARSATVPGFPLSVKLNGEDFEPDGLGIEEALIAAQLFVEAGAEHIEVSGGTPAAAKNGPVRLGITREREAYFREHAKAVKRAVNVPVGTVGGIRSFEVAEELLATGVADSLAMARPLVCEPDLPLRWLRGDRAPSLCRSDSRCFVAGLKGGIRCVTREEGLV